MYLGRRPYGGLEGALPSFEKAKNLKPNTYKESKLMITHGRPKLVSPTCAPQPPQSSTRLQEAGGQQQRASRKNTVGMTPKTVAAIFGYRVESCIC